MEFRFRGIRQATGEQIVSMITAADEFVARREIEEKGIVIKEIYPALDERPVGADGRNPDTLLMLLSLIMPLGGLIAGAVFLVSDHSSDRRTGRSCLFASLIGCLIGGIILIGALSGR